LIELVITKIEEKSKKQQHPGNSQVRISKLISEAWNNFTQVEKERSLSKPRTSLAWARQLAAGKTTNDRLKPSDETQLFEPKVEIQPKSL